jgi:hypothetical protein
MGSTSRILSGDHFMTFGNPFSMAQARALSNFSVAPGRKPRNFIYFPKRHIQFRSQFFISLRRVKSNLILKGPEGNMSGEWSRQGLPWSRAPE